VVRHDLCKLGRFLLKHFFCILLKRASFASFGTGLCFKNHALELFRPSESDVRRKIVSLVGQHFRFVNTVLEKYSFLPSGDPVKIFPKKIKVRLALIQEKRIVLLSFVPCNSHGIPGANDCCKNSHIIGVVVG
jgi:hypothetical protein